MRKLLNTLYITNKHCYVSRDRENIVISVEKKIVKRFPIHILEGIICFNYNGASPGIIKLCAEHNISIAFLTPSGRLCGRFVGKTNGNVFLRREQYRIADDKTLSLGIARNMIYAKLINSRTVLHRLIRDHKEKIDADKITISAQKIFTQIQKLETVQDADALRGIEGDCAREYFGCFNAMILQQQDDFYFNERIKRPPKDNVNAMLSFFYSVLTYDIQSALESVGLDSYVGFLHTDRPGRPSLALDMIEELRAYLVDRFVITCINKRIVDPQCFQTKENETVLLNDKGRQRMLDAWQKRKQEEIRHPFLQENVKIGLLPFVQAQLLSRYIRGDIEAYPPFVI